MLPSANELTYFVEVASTQNISRASERLGISQPSLSLGIKRLEHQLGLTLLVRSKTGVTLTRAGHRLREEASDLLERWQSVVNHAKRDEKEVSGRYRIGAHVSVARNRLSHVLADLMQHHPDLEFQLDHDLSRKLTERVISFELDFGVVVNPVAHPDLVMRPVYNDEFCFFSRRKLDLAKYESAVLYYDPDLLQSRWLLNKARENKIHFKRTFTSNSLDVLADLAMKSDAIAILPQGVVTYMNMPLTQAFNQIPPFKDTHTLIYRSDVQNSPAARKLARALEAGLSLGHQTFARGGRESP